LASAAANLGTTVGRINHNILIYRCDSSVAYSLPWPMRTPRSLS
jgi:hypothetical protein